MHLKGLDIQSSKCNLTPKAPAGDGRWCCVAGWGTQNSGPPTDLISRACPSRSASNQAFAGDRSPVPNKALTRAREGLVFRDAGRYKGGKDLGPGNNAGFQEQNQEARWNSS